MERLVSVGQVVTAWQAQHAVEDDVMPVGALAELHTQAAMDSSTLELREGGVDFTAFSYVPEIDPLTGLRLLTHEDDIHKLKLLASHIRSQQAPTPATAAASAAAPPPGTARPGSGRPSPRPPVEEDGAAVQPVQSISSVGASCRQPQQ